MALIQGIYAREILDSRGVPTLEATLWLDNGGIVATSAPTGTSVGKYEAHELRDKDANRMLGKGVLQAVNHINTTIAPAIIGKDPLDQEGIDQLLVQMDGTPDRGKLGANTLITVSQAVLKAGALVQNVPLYYYILQKYQLTDGLALPSCIFTMVSGGEHGAGNLDIQEFQIIPASHFDYASALNMGVTIFHKLEEVLVLKGAIHSVGMAGGFTPNLYSNTDVFEILVETIKTSPYTFAQDLFFGMDVAAEQIFENGKYKLKDRSQPYSSKELSEYYKKLRSLYHVFCIEDPFQEDDLDSWKLLTAEIGETTRIIGDSFLATNKEKTQKAIEQKSCNTLLVKPNQVGTITDTIEVIKLARSAGWQIIISHRSGETNDDLIADFAVGVGADYVRFGPPNRGERVAKYNRLSQINQEIIYSQGGQQATETKPSENAKPAESTKPSEEVSVQPAPTETLPTPTESEVAPVTTPPPQPAPAQETSPPSQVQEQTITLPETQAATEETEVKAATKTETELPPATPQEVKTATAPMPSTTPPTPTPPVMEQKAPTPPAVEQPKAPATPVTPITPTAPVVSTAPSQPTASTPTPAPSLPPTPTPPVVGQEQPKTSPAPITSPASTTPPPPEKPHEQ